jgi:hypothetical protein
VDARAEPDAGVAETTAGGERGAAHARAQPGERGDGRREEDTGARAARGEERRPTRGEPRRPLLDLELEHLRVRVDGLDRCGLDDALPAQDRRAQDERRSAAAPRLEDDALDRPDACPPPADDEPLRVHEPVLEHVAAAPEDVVPHVAPIPRSRMRPNLRGAAACLKCHETPADTRDMLRLSAFVSALGFAISLAALLGKAVGGIRRS